MDVFRTPDERFADLAGYDFAPHYTEVDGLRLHRVDEGEGSPVLCFHGEPTWAYLYRHMLGPPRRRRSPRRLPGPRRVRALGQADRSRLVHVRAARRERQRPSRDARPAGRHRRRPGLGRAHRPALGRRERRPRRAPRRPEHGPLHRPREQGLPGLARLRRAHARPADRRDRPERDDDRPPAGDRRRVRGAVPDRREQGGRRDVPAARPDERRRAGRDARWPPSRTRCARGTSPRSSRSPTATRSSLPEGGRGVRGPAADGRRSRSASRARRTSCRRTAASRSPTR